jgi:hypothetical protein
MSIIIISFFTKVYTYHTPSSCYDVSGLKEHWDSDGAHVYYKPSPDDPEAWRDWLNPPDQANQDWKALAQAELQNALNVSMGIQHHQHWW